MKNLLLILIAFSLTSAALAEHYSLDGWLSQYSLTTGRAVIVDSGVNVARGDVLNGLIPPPSSENDIAENIRKALKNHCGIEIIPFGDNFARCKWSDDKSLAAIVEKTKQSLRAAVDIDPEEIPNRVVIGPNMRLELIKP